MRTKEQNAKRYFSAIWAVLTLVGGVLAVSVALVDEPIPDYAFIITVIVASVAAAVIGFLHGITLFVARAHDAEDSAE